MPVFTLELKKVAALFPEDQGLNVYPVYEGAPNGFRAELNKKILDHFWNREICMESVSMWRFNMRRKMNEIMPYYNQLYKSELINIDPISTMNIAGRSKADSTQQNDTTQQSTSTQATNGSDSQTATGEQSTTSAQNSTSKTVASDYPQTALDEGDGAQYATSSQQSVGAGTGAGTASENRTTNGTRNETGNSTQNDVAAQNGVATQNGETTTVGYTGAPSDLLMRYRATFLNIDMMVISDLEELFMTVWDNGDSYTNGIY